MKKYTFCLIPDTGAAPKQVTLSLGWFAAAAVVCLAAVVALGLLVYDYGQLKGADERADLLAREVTDQKDTIERQKIQIARFAKSMNSFKDSLATISEFERRIRILASLEQPGESDGVLGVGGSMPDDLDPSLPMSARNGALVREMSEQARDLSEVTLLQEKNLESLVKQLEEKRDILACTPSVRPVEGWVTSRFGSRTSPFTGLKEFHKGLDIGAAKGTKILCPANGRVTYVGTKGRLGRVVVVDHGHGMVTRYAHMHKSLCRKGDQIKRGDVIGQVGSTGRSTGPHLHYEVHLNGIPVNPERYILN